MRHSLRNTHNTVFIYIRQTWDIFTHILCYVACDVWHLYSGRLMCHNLRYLVTLITITVTINITITISLTLSAYLLGSLTDLQDPRFRGDEGELEVDGSICCSWFPEGKRQMQVFFNRQILELNRGIKSYWIPRWIFEKSLHFRLIVAQQVWSILRCV